MPKPNRADAMGILSCDGGLYLGGVRGGPTQHAGATTSRIPDIVNQTDKLHKKPGYKI